MPLFDQFRTKVMEGMMPNNRFLVSAPKLGRNALFLATDVTLPVISYTTLEWKQTGHGVKIPNEFTFEPFTITFQIDKTGSPYREAFQWLDSITTEDYAFNDMSTYTDNIIIFEYNRQDEMTAQWKYKDAYPTNISERSKSNISNTTIDTFTINFNYKDSTYN